MLWQSDMQLLRPGWAQECLLRPVAEFRERVRIRRMRVSDETANIHPRPQLRRTRWFDLCGPWAFQFDDQDEGLRERWFERADVFSAEIMVPYPPESRLSGVHDTGFHPVVWYRREFSLDEIRQCERLQ